MPSLTARAFQSLLGAIISRRNLANEQQVREAARPGDRLAVPRMGKRVTVDYQDVGGYRVITVRPRTRPVRMHILYLPGGGYVNGPVFLHWWFIARLATTFGAQCTVPRYPLAPAAQCDEAIAFVGAVYREMVDELGADEVVVMGDSAGGGLALAMLQHTGISPAKLILHSPWLDASVSDPSQPGIERHDWLLNRFILRTWGQWWAGHRNLREPAVSPLFGDLSILPQTLIIGGSKDILAPDARRLALAAPNKVTYLEEEALMHTYALFPFFPETRQAWRTIRAFLAV